MITKPSDSQAAASTPSSKKKSLRPNQLILPAELDALTATWLRGYQTGCFTVSFPTHSGAKQLQTLLYRAKGVFNRALEDGSTTSFTPEETEAYLSCRIIVSSPKSPPPYTVSVVSDITRGLDCFKTLTEALSLPSNPDPSNPDLSNPDRK